MIKANELRIENWIKYDNKFWQVDALSSFPTIGISSIKESLTLGEYQAEPIPLTPGILEKCGWGKSDEHEMGTNMLNENNDGLYFDYHFKRFRMDFGDNADIRMPHIQYLHQLQNLYFALTGEELNVQLSEPKVE